MSRGIELSPKYGVNCTIPVCFWCGKDKNQIAMMGRVRERDPETGRAVKGSDLQVPMKMVLDYEPCDDCMAEFSKGVQIIEVDHVAPDQRPAMGQDDQKRSVYPTGRTLVMYAEAAQRVFGNESLTAGKSAMIDKNSFNYFLAQINSDSKENI